jgi:hypothetical protein
LEIISMIAICNVDDFSKTLVCDFQEVRLGPDPSPKMLSFDQNSIIYPDNENLNLYLLINKAGLDKISINSGSCTPTTTQAGGEKGIEYY